MSSPEVLPRHHLPFEKRMDMMDVKGLVLLLVVAERPGKVYEAAARSRTLVPWLPCSAWAEVARFFS